MMCVSDRWYKNSVYEQYSVVGKAVASPRRLELLDLICQSEKTVERLARETGQSVANTSQHLKTLREARLVETRKEGQWVYYRLAADEVCQFILALRKLAESRLAELENIARRYLAGHGEIEPVDREQLIERVRDGSAVVLDVRPAEEYRTGHIPGAISVELEDLERKLAELPRDRQIVAYCRGPYCVLSVHAVEMLRRKGFKAARLDEGTQEWRARGFALAAGE